jgi:hypothetical protein
MTAEVGQLIHRYRQDQLSGARVCSADMSSLRTTLCRLSGRFGSERFLSGQHDPQEAMALLMDRIQDRLPADYFRTLVTRRYWFVPGGWQPVQSSGLIFDPERSRRENRQVYYSETRERSPCQIEISITHARAGLFELLNDHFSQRDSQSDPGHYLLQSLDGGRFIEQNCQHLETSIAFDRTPARLSILLKRFDSDGDKISDEVRVSEKITLSKKATGEADQSYVLKSFIQHQGLFAAGGHYVAYVQENGRYYLLDDMAGGPREISREEFINQAKTAYRLNYIRTE